MTTRQDIIDATRHYLLGAGLTLEEVDALAVERLRVQEHREVIRWALKGGERPAILEPPRRGRRVHVAGWRHQSLDEKTLAIVGDAELPPLTPKTARQVAREAELEAERIEREKREEDERMVREERAVAVEPELRSGTEERRT